MAETPTVSVVIDNFNYAAFLPDAIESALHQSRTPLEVIVVDDGSTDGSRDIIDAFGDRVSAVLKANEGQASALSAGVAMARGDIICFLDADDTWAETKVARVTEVFRARPEVDWVRHRLTVTDAKLRPLGPEVPVIRRAGPVPMGPYHFIEWTVSASTSGLAVRRSARQGVFPLPTAAPTMRWDADRVLVALLGLGGARGWSLAESLGCYRRHGAQQFTGTMDVRALLERQVATADFVLTLFEERLGRPFDSPARHKHRLVLEHLAGGRPLRRVPTLLRGLRAAAGVARASPRLAARQAGGLLTAFLAPDPWIRRLLAREGFHAEPGIEP